MDTVRHTDERLKCWLNANQSGRERMCLGILALDRNYSDIKPRRPEGGRDGGRDLECLRLGQRCFGAIGFANSACDSSQDKREIRKKFCDDVATARAADSEVLSFVFFTNVDFTPGEITELVEAAMNAGFTFAEIYWRERLRIALDSAEGLALRFQFLGINLSEAEQATFFARFGQDLEDLLRGRFDRIERKIDELEFSRWKAGAIKRCSVDIDFNEYRPSLHTAPEHFRVCLELQSVESQKRSIIIGARDDFVPAPEGKYYFGSKQFIWRQNDGKEHAAWTPHGVRVHGGTITGIHLGYEWRPISHTLVQEFDWLKLHFHFTENLIDRIARVRFTIDSYLFLDWKFTGPDTYGGRPSIWPDELTDAEKSVAWRFKDLGAIHLDRMVPRKVQ